MEYTEMLKDPDDLDLVIDVFEDPDDLLLDEDFDNLDIDLPDTEEE